MVITDVGASGSADAAVEVAAATGGSVASGVTAGVTARVAGAAGVGVTSVAVLVPGAPGMLATSPSPTRSSGASGTRRISVRVAPAGTANQTQPRARSPVGSVRPDKAGSPPATLPLR